MAHAPADKSAGRSRRRGKRRAGRRAPAGTPPGALRIDAAAHPSKVDVLAYDTEGVEEYVADEARIQQAPIEYEGVQWVNIVGLGTESVLRAVAATFGVHALAMEDIVNTYQRPKVEDYGDHVFIVLRLPHVDETLTIEQISIYAGPGFVLTFQEFSGDCFEPIRERIRKNWGRIRGLGADYLAYALIDAVVDHYFPLLEQYGDRLDALEEEIIAGTTSEVMTRILDLKRELLRVRRSVWPLRDAIRNLLGGGHGLLTEDTKIYLRDCYDHLVIAVDLLDSHREVDSNLVNVHLSVVSQKMNEIMKVLTIIATVFIPLSFVAGLYGMNFDPTVSRWNMPELSWVYGYPFALTLMAAMTAGLLYYFRRKGWLGGD